MMHLAAPRLFGVVALAASLIAVASTASAQITWRPVTSFNQPPAIPDGVGYDAATSKTMWCGSNPATGSVEVWSFDGTDWSAENNAGAPAADHRDTHTASWDTARQTFVLYGRGETWEWSQGTQWINASPAITQAVPGNWDDVSMTFDPVRGETLLFGGKRIQPATGEEIYADRLWAWDGSEWRVYAPPGNAPLGRTRCSLSHDPVTGNCIVHGGLSSFYVNRVQTYVVHYDTWIWDGSLWSRPGNSTPGNSASGVLGHGMAYDERRGRTVVVAGSTLGGYTSKTWDFDGSEWTERSVAGPSLREGGKLVFDSANDKLLLIGGSPNAEMWELDIDQPASHQSYGASCGGTSTQTAPTLVGDALPYAGDTYSLQIENVPATPTSAILALSGYRLPAPIDLGIIGMTGCTLYNEIHVTQARATTPGSPTRFEFSILEPVLIGSSILHQAFVIDPQANALGLATTNGVSSTVGLR